MRCSLLLLTTASTLLGLEGGGSAGDVLDGDAKLGARGYLLLLLAAVFELEPLLLEVSLDGDEDLSEELVFAEFLVKDPDVHGGGLSGDDDDLLVLLLGLLELLGLLRVSVEANAEVRQEVCWKVLARMDRDLVGSQRRGVVEERLNLGDEVLVEGTRAGFTHGNDVPFGRANAPQLAHDLSGTVTARAAELETGDFAIGIVDQLEVSGVNKTNVRTRNLREASTLTSIEDSDEEEQFIGSTRNSREINVDLFVVVSFPGLRVSLMENCTVLGFVVAHGINVIDELFVAEHEDSKIEVLTSLPAKTAKQLGNVGSDDNFFSFDGAEGLGERLFSVNGCDELLVNKEFLE